MAPNTPYSLRKLVIHYYLRGNSQRQISALTTVSKSTVNRIVQHYKRYGCIERAKPKGRPRKVGHRAITLLIRLARTCPHMSSTQHKISWSYGRLYATSRIRQILRANGLHGRVAPKKPKVVLRHRRNRMAWCRMMTSNAQRDFDRWVFSAESKFELFSSRRQLVWRPVGNAVDRHHPKYLATSTTTRSPSLMVWGAIWSSGLRILVRVTGNMTGDDYINILQRHMLPIWDDSSFFCPGQCPASF